MGVAERPCKHRNTLRLMLALCSGSNSEFPCSGQQGLASVMQSLPLLRSSEGHVLCTVHPHKMCAPSPSHRAAAQMEEDCPTTPSFTRAWHQHAPGKNHTCRVPIARPAERTEEDAPARTGWGAHSPGLRLLAAGRIYIGITLHDTAPYPIPTMRYGQCCVISEPPYLISPNHAPLSVNSSALKQAPRISL